MSVVEDSGTDLRTHLFGHRLSQAVALDYGTEPDRLFWTDISDSTISQAFISEVESSPGVLFGGLVHPDGLAWDWIGQNVFYTDTGLNSIGIVTVIGSYHVSLIASGLDEPRAIALDPAAG